MSLFQACDLSTGIDSNILILGAAQTFFECAMYIFVLLYTPAIETAASIHGM